MIFANDNNNNDTYVIVLSDGSELTGITLNGTTWESATELMDSDFAGKLSVITIENQVTGESTTLVDVEPPFIGYSADSERYWFVLREQPRAERFEEMVLLALAELAETLASNNS